MSYHIDSPNAKVKILQNFKVSTNSGWMLNKRIYKVSDIEGGKETVRKLIDKKKAELVEETKPTTIIVKPRKVGGLSSDEETQTKELLRENAKKRRASHAQSLAQTEK